MGLSKIKKKKNLAHANEGRPHSSTATNRSSKPENSKLKAQKYQIRKFNPAKIKFSYLHQYKLPVQTNPIAKPNPKPKLWKPSLMEAKSNKPN